MQTSASANAYPAAVLDVSAACSHRQVKTLAKPGHADGTFDGTWAKAAAKSRYLSN
jgi:hypothetical protein